MSYVVAYDLDSPGQNYARIDSELRRLGANKILESTWTVTWSAGAVALRDHLRRFIDSNDRLLVALMNGWASWNTISKPS